MNKVKRRSKKNCRYISTKDSKMGYCMSGKTSWLFCDGVCQFFRGRTTTKEK